MSVEVKFDSHSNLSMAWVMFACASLHRPGQISRPPAEQAKNAAAQADALLSEFEERLHRDPVP